MNLMTIRRSQPIRRRNKEGNYHMVEIEKPRIECVENPGDGSYGKYV